MFWFALAGLSALAQGLADVQSKRLKTVEPFLYLAAITTLTAIACWSVVAFTGIPDLKDGFWTGLAVSAVLNVVANTVYVRALRMEETSAVLPLIAFTPALMLVVVPFVTGETVSALGVVGVGLLVVGVYALHAARLREGPLEPVRSLVRSRAARMMLLVAVLWAVTSSFDALASRASAPAFYIAANMTVQATCFWALSRGRGIRTAASREGVSILVAGGLFAASLLALITAFATGPSPYVMAIRRLSILVAALGSVYLLKERHRKERYVGIALVIAGVACIAFA